MFLPEGRGASAHRAIEESLRYMFTKTDCMEIVTKCPVDNPASLGAARAMGFQRTFHLDFGWPREDGSRGGVDCMRLHISKWMEKDSSLEAEGVWFHEELEKLAAIPVHYDESAHNRAVGDSFPI